MGGKPSIEDAASPCSVTSVRASGRPTFYLLADAKAALGLLPSDHADDAELQIKIDNAAAILEDILDRALAPQTLTAEYKVPYGCQVLRIPVSDVTAVTAVREYSDTGAATALPEASYELVESLDNTYIRRTDDDDFTPRGGSVAVDVAFTTEVRAGDRASRHVVVLMNFLIEEQSKGMGMTTSSSMRHNPAFMRLVSLAKGNTISDRPII